MKSTLKFLIGVGLVIAGSYSLKNAEAAKMSPELIFKMIQGVPPNGSQESLKALRTQISALPDRPEKKILERYVQAFQKQLALDDAEELLMLTGATAEQLASVPDMSFGARKQFALTALLAARDMDIERSGQLKRKLAPLLKELTDLQPSDPDVLFYYYYLLNPYSQESCSKMLEAANRCLELDPNHRLCKKGLQNFKDALARPKCETKALHSTLKLEVAAKPSKDGGTRRVLAIMDMDPLLTGAKQTSNENHIEVSFSAEGIRKLRERIGETPKEQVDLSFIIHGTTEKPMSWRSLTHTPFYELNGVSFREVCNPSR